MIIFKYKEDRIPFLLISLYFIVDILYYFKVDQLSYIITWGVAGIVIKGLIAAWNHNHQHFNTFQHPVLNRAIEVVFGMYTGICGYAWVLHHNIGHHSNYLDQAKDESRWQNKKGERMWRIRYSLEVFFTSYWRCFKVGLRKPKILGYFIAMTTLTVGIMAVLTYYRPLPALIILWIPCLLSLLITADSTYWHHSGLSTDNLYVASRNTINDGCFNVLTGNFGYHTAHHLRPAVHWTKLPRIHEKIKDRIPLECYVENTPFFAALDFIFLGVKALHQDLSREKRLKSLIRGD